jgi:hypothetical protein
MGGMVALACVMLGCGESSPTAPSPTTIAFALPSGWNVSDLSYLVLASDGGTLDSGSEIVSDPSAGLSFQLQLPTGRGETLQLKVTTGTGVSCSGTSQPFDVVAGRPTAVSVVLTCVSPGPNSCPLVEVNGPMPLEAVAPSGTIAVGATASDVDPADPLSFSWTATAGTFSDPAAISTLYVCTDVGAQTLVLSVADHHPSSSCVLTFLVPVSCLAASGGSAAGP